jgi:site-specific DNA-methyltransferase (adenine-specific)
MKQRTEQNGSKNDNWATPEYIYDMIEQLYGFKDMFDPCPLNHNLNKWNGLKIDWKPLNYVNPPYNNKDKVAFIKKAYEESLKGNTTIMLIPASTDIAIFHEIILPNAEIRFLKGRVKFKGYNSKGEYVTNKCGQSGSMFVIFRGRKSPNNKD